MSSLITTVRSKFLEAIRAVQPQGRWKVLVVDEHSQKLLGSVLKQFDILEENVTMIESITNNREPQPEIEAIYLLMPTSQNTDRIIRDFDGKRQYAKAHLVFVDELPQDLLERLFNSPASPYLGTTQDLYLNFWAAEAQTFLTKTPEHFFSLYSPPRNDAEAKMARDRLEEHLHFSSKCIANVCITLNENPYIRYYVPANHGPLGGLKPHETTRPPPPPEASSRWRTNLARGAEARAYESVDSDHATKLLAFYTQQLLDEYKKNNPDFGKPSEPSRGRATLFITDRSMDMLAPFIHEFTYQAMANDLLPIEDGTRYTYKFQSSIGAYEDKTAILSDSDTVWTTVRHMHMREAIDKLMADFNTFIQENAVFKGDNAANLNDMKDMLANLPQYQEQREKFSLHLNVAESCMNIFEHDKLPLVANVEQNCATGLTAEGKAPKNLVEEMVPLLDSRDVINPSKVRIIALYIQHRDGVPEEDRRRLYQHARLSNAEQDAVNAILHLGVRLSRGPSDRDSKKIKQKPKDDEYELSRFKPLLRTILQDHVANKLDPSLFPYVKESPLIAPAVQAPVAANSLRSQKPSWHRGARQTTNTQTKPRLIVFMAGGMTFSEVREAYELSSLLSKEIIIGSTHTITPRQFVDDLKVLDLGGVGSKAVPNGLPSVRGPRPFQEYYDEKFFTRDAPPPARPAPPAAQPRHDGHHLLRPSPQSSFTGSTNSVASSMTGGKEKEKKKNKFFRF
ncbi:hypothetical protein HWV62_22523 [Athelia sp. TMB]|nr:hypothetical protein HWV62_22523 [Athelia sp. TMB]